MTLRIIIADDHPVVRVGTKSVIEASGVGEVVAQASGVDELYEILDTTECDVLVTDYSMPGSRKPDGLAMIGTIRRKFPDLHVLLLTVSNNLAILRVVVNEGVKGLVEKSSSMDELPVAIQTVARGHPYICRTLKERIDMIGTQGMGDDRTRVLSPREVEVLRLLGSGLIVKEIAKKLHKSVSTISRQKGDAMLKLGLKSDAELYDYMRDNKL